MAKANLLLVRKIRHQQYTVRNQHTHHKHTLHSLYSKMPNSVSQQRCRLNINHTSLAVRKVLYFRFGAKAFLETGTLTRRISSSVKWDHSNQPI